MERRSAARADERGAMSDLHAEPQGSAAGKVILLGEHAAVYGKHAVVLPIPTAVTARIIESDSGESKFISDLLQVVRNELGIEGDTFGVDLRSTLPPGMGLGASAAIAVAIIRAVSSARELGLDAAAVNRVAFECEKISHGNPSGVDNAIATFAVPMLFSNESELNIEQLELKEPPPLVIGGDAACGVRTRHTGSDREGIEVLRDHLRRQWDGLRHRDAGRLVLDQ